LLAERAKAAEDRAKNQIQYLNPLRVAAMDLRERLRIVDQRIARQDTLLGDTVIEVHDRASTASPADFAVWANGMGQFALSTMHLICVYLARASRIRAELPFVRLSARGDQELLERLSRVRHSLGGEYGLWESLQDSLGSYVQQNDGTLRNHREFCEQLEDPNRVEWFGRLVEFLHDMLLKTATERQSHIDSLDSLIDFLAEQPSITAQRHRSLNTGDVSSTGA
jgi:hypothetical protein